MNTYGDRGNLLTLERRAQWHGIDPVLHYYSAGQQFPRDVDIVLGGGGQDSAQSGIQTDILKLGDKIHSLVEAAVPMLLVCGTYQLFGNNFITSANEEIRGIGVFNLKTVGNPKRLIGNTAVETQEFGTLYGFENHSGKTYLAPGQSTLGTVVRGNGNNGEDKTEGARVNNTIGTYLHGPLLPNNPQLADGLIRLALQRKGEELPERAIDDSLTFQARHNASARNY